MINGRLTKDFDLDFGALGKHKVQVELNLCWIKDGFEIRHFDYSVINPSKTMSPIRDFSPPEDLQKQILEAMLSEIKLVTLDKVKLYNINKFGGANENKG